MAKSWSQKGQNGQYSAEEWMAWNQGGSWHEGAGEWTASSGSWQAAAGDTRQEADGRWPSWGGLDDGLDQRGWMTMAGESGGRLLVPLPEDAAFDGDDTMTVPSPRSAPDIEKLNELGHRGGISDNRQLSGGQRPEQTEEGKRPAAQAEEGEERQPAAAAAVEDVHMATISSNETMRSGGCGTEDGEEQPAAAKPKGECPKGGRNHDT